MAAHVKILCPSILQCLAVRHLQTSVSVMGAKHIRAGRYKPSKKRTTKLTYEEAKAPHLIGVEKSWNTWNTSNLLGEGRKSETLVEDSFIRQFMNGTWINYLHTDVVIKRRHNTINIASIMEKPRSVQEFYFLLGYSEELLSCLLKCPVKIEVQTVASKDDLVFKYI